MKTRNYIVVAALAVAMSLQLAACSNDEATTVNGGEALPDGMYPLEIGEVTIGVEGGEAQPWGAKTRVAETTDGTGSEWSDGDAISVQIGSGDIGTYKYTIDSESNSGSFTAVTPCYWQSTATQDVTAWYPANATSTTIDLSDQSSGLAYVMKATAEGVAFNNAASLEFKHQLAKVRVKIDEKIVPATVSVLGNTQCTVSSDGTVTASGNQKYIPMHKATYDGTTYYEACLVPGTSLKDNAIKIVAGKYTMTANLDQEVMLTAGAMHDLSITSDVGLCDLSQLSSFYEISDGGTYYVTGSGKYGIKVKGGNNPTIVLDDATINVPYSIGGNGISGTTSYTIELKGKNSVTSKGDYSAITVSSSETLTIGGDGELTATNSSSNYGGAGIGGGYNNSPCGNITIKGGTITATSSSGYGAGIGGGCDKSSCGNIIISGGTVTAKSGGEGAGIGGGYNNSSCGTITISGGTVKAESRANGAGIGGGYNNSSCGNISISGGTVTAESGGFGAGIGGGYKNSSCGSISISGGTVTAESGGYGAGIGGGCDKSSCGSISISGGTVTAESGDYGDDVGNGASESNCSGKSIIVTVHDKDGNVVN